LCIKIKLLFYLELNKVKEDVLRVGKLNVLTALTKRNALCGKIVAVMLGEGRDRL
jgi:hypothetical protein